MKEHKLLVYRSESSLDAVLVFVDDTDQIKEADQMVFGDWGEGYNRVAELTVIGDNDGELYTLHPYEG